MNGFNNDNQPGKDGPPLTRLERVKSHVQRQKRFYILGSAAVGLLGAYGLGRSHGTKAEVIATIKGIHYKSTNIIVTELERRGHPGNMLVCKETGEVFASQNRACELMGLDKGNLSKHLKGETPCVKGYSFEKLGEAV